MAGTNKASTNRRYSTWVEPNVAGRLRTEKRNCLFGPLDPPLHGAVDGEAETPNQIRGNSVQNGITLEHLARCRTRKCGPFADVSALDI